MRHLAAAVTATVFLLVGCGGDSVTGPKAQEELPAGSMSARIAGSAWSATSALAVTYSGGILAFAGSDASAVTIGIGVIPNGPGTYPIGPSQPTNANLTFGQGGSWSATSHQGSGSVTVTSITQTTASGTFEFTAEPVASTNATGTRVVTQGVFSVKF